MEDIIQWIAIAAFWLISSLIRKGREKQQSEPSTEPARIPSATSQLPEQELDQIHKLAKHIDGLETWLTQLPTHCRWALPIVRHVLKPQVAHLMWQASEVIQNPSIDAAFLVQRQRVQLSSLTHRLGQETQVIQDGGRPEVWVGQALLDGLPELASECIDLVPAWPSMEILAQVNLTREELQHVYAAWAPQVFADVSTAILVPERAQIALNAIASAANANRARGAEIPWVIRGHVLSEALKTSFNAPGGHGDLAITLTDEQTYAVPTAIVAKDIRALVRHMLSESFDMLGSKRLAELVFAEEKKAPATPKVEIASAYTIQPSKIAHSRRKRQSMKHVVRDAILINEIYRI
jgi:hypothetical protein